MLKPLFKKSAARFAVLLSLILPAVASANAAVSDVFYFEYQGQNLPYQILDEDAATVQTKPGIFSSATVKPGHSFSESSVSLVIPQTVEYQGKEYAVTAIGEDSYTDAAALKSVELPSTVTVIGNSAFSGCTNLESITLPENLETIGNLVFYNCSQLKGVVLPAKLSTLGWYAFYNCSKITEITLPENLTEIGNYAFQESGLKTIEIPASVKSIGDEAFGSCPNITSFVIADSTEPIELGLRIFWETKSLKSVYLGRQYLLKDNTYLCYEVTDLESVTFSENVTGIPGRSFYNCYKLKTVNIPASVTSIGEYAFILSYALNEISLPEKLESIGRGAFKYGGLKKIVLPSSLKSIGDDAFSELSSQVEVTIADSSEPLLLNTTIFSKTKVTSLYLGRECEGYSFGSDLEDLTISDRVSTIPESAFEKNKLKTLTIKDSDQPLMIEKSGLFSPSVSAYIGRNWTGLNVSCSNITLSDYVTEIPANAFAGSFIKTISMPKNLTAIGAGAFSGCTGLTFAALNENLASIGKEAFKGCSKLSSINFPESLTEIGESAFENCSALTKIDLTFNMTTLGKGAFYNCSGITAVTIPGSLNVLNEFVFRSDPIKEVRIEYGPEPLTIDYFVFSNTFLENLYIDRDLVFSSSNDDQFSRVVKLVYGNTVTSIPDGGARTGYYLKKLTLGSSITKIGAKAFEKSALGVFILPPALQEISSSSFSGVTSLKEIAFGNDLEGISTALDNTGSSISAVYTTSKSLVESSKFQQSAKFFVLPEMVDTYKAKYQNVEAMIPPERVEIKYNGNASSLSRGDKVQLTGTVIPANATLGGYVFWKSTNPDVATVDNEGFVTYRGMSDTEDECQILAMTLYSDCPVASITVGANGVTSGIEAVEVESTFGSDDINRPSDVYNLQGILIKRNASAEDIEALAPGMYIVGGKKVRVM